VARPGPPGRVASPHHLICTAADGPDPRDNRVRSGPSASGTWWGPATPG